MGCAVEGRPLESFVIKKSLFFKKINDVQPNLPVAIKFPKEGN
jgi:hypothetical protein